MLPRIHHKCNILVKNAADGSTRGYLSRTRADFGYGVFQESQEGSLEVSFDTSSDDLSPSELDFFAENALDPSAPYIGANWLYGEGGWDLNTETGSLASIEDNGTPTLPGSSPTSSGWESAIWKYNPVTQDITVQWINSDGSSPPSHLVYSSLWEVVGITGNASRYESITFTCVPPPPIQPVR